MDFRILGPLEVWEGERRIDPGGSKRRALLAFLLLHANEVVSTDRLIDQLWDETAPSNAPAALQTHISRVRKDLGPDLVATRAWGYVLRIEPNAIDLERFRSLVADAENLPAQERAEKLSEALSLWRGGALEDLAFEPALAKDIAQLEELHLAVLENRIDADLEAGNHTAVIGELETLIAENPLRERLRSQLILALYRSGRQAEALEVYRETRRLLAEQLGLEPSPELRELERAILRQDPSLTAAAVSSESRSAEQPRPGRRRRLFLSAVAVLLLGIIAAVTALVTRSTHVAKHATAHEQHAVTTTVSSASISQRVTHRASGNLVVRHRVRTARRGVRTQTTTTTHPVTTVPRRRGLRLPDRTGLRSTGPVAKPATKPSQPGKSSKLIRLADDFRDPTIDPLIWNVWIGGSGGTATQPNGQLVLSLPANSTFDSRFRESDINVGTKCKFPDNFDARVDFTLLDWPPGNGASASLVGYETGPIEEISRTSNSYGDFYNDWPDRGSAPLADTSGSLRLARSNGVLRSYIWHHDRWKQLGAQTISGEIWVGMTLSAFSKDWQDMPVSAAFDNFVVTAPAAGCPAGSEP